MMDGSFVDAPQLFLMKKPSLLIIFLTVFIDLVGFGIVLPSLPIFAEHLEADGFTIGLLMASYSTMQFIFAPIWGRISDRVGRRPILLFSTAGASISYVIYAIGSGMTGRGALALLFASRLFAGICGANITVAQAYIADISAPEERSKRMGLIGMAFGFGFIFGPVLSGLGMHAFGVTGPGWIAAGLCAANFFFTLIRLPESWKPSAEAKVNQPRFAFFFQMMKKPKIGLLVGLFFLGTFVFGAFETTLGLLVSHNFGLSVQGGNGSFVYDPKIAYLYAFCGTIGAVVQGGVIGHAVKWMGEPILIALSFLLVAIGLIPMPFLAPDSLGWAGLLVFLATVSIGSSLTRPPIFGMLSNLTPAAEQGVTIGIAQSVGSLARIAGPIFAGVLFSRHPIHLYLICSLISFVSCAMAWLHLRSSRASSK